MIINENQVRQLYVANTTADSSSFVPSVAGDLKVKTKANQFAFFNYFGVDLQRSDLMFKGKVDSIKITPAAKMIRNLKAVEVNLTPTSVTAGEDYVLRIAIKQAFGASDEDVYFKYAVVHGVSGMTVPQFYVAMAKSLFENFKRENTHWFNFYLIAGTTTKTYTVINASTDFSSLSGTYTGIQIEEAVQPFRKGLIDDVPVLFDVYPGDITSGNDTIKWGTAVAGTAQGAAVKNSKKTAALEYFLAGEKGDQYRQINWPYTIDTTYLVDPTASKGYDYLDIQYHFAGDAEDVNKSPKTITIVIPADEDTMSASGASYAKLKEIANKIAGVTGATVEGLLD